MVQNKKEKHHLERNQIVVTIELPRKYTVSIIVHIQKTKCKCHTARWDFFPVGCKKASLSSRVKQGKDPSWQSTLHSTGSAIYRSSGKYTEFFLDRNEMRWLARTVYT